MLITEILKVNNIKVFLESKDKKSVIKELIDVALPGLAIDEGDEIYKAVLEREKISSTGIGECVAIPHARIDFCDCLIAGCGISKEPIEYQSLDNKPVSLFFIILCPKMKTDIFLKFLARVSRLLHYEHDLIQKLIDSNSAEEVYNTFLEYENKHFS